jgi:Rhs element Vgr protein
MVKVGGSKISPISYCSINQRIDWHHTFEILLPVEGFKKDNATILDQAAVFVGKRIEIAFKINKPKEDNRQNEFHGIVTEVSLSRRNGGNREVLLRGFSPTVLLDGRLNCKFFFEKSLREIVASIHDRVTQNDLKINSNPAFADDIPHIVQYKESNFHFLNRIADKYGEWCFYDGMEFNFGKLNKNDQSKKANIPIDQCLSDFEFSMRLQNIDYKAVTYDYLKNQTYSHETGNIQINDLDNYGNLTLNESGSVYKQKNVFYSPGYFKNERDFNDKNETRKFGSSKELIFTDGVSDDPYFNVGSIINITNESTRQENYGEFIVISLNHSIDVTGNYVNHFTAVPAQANIPPLNRNIIMPISETQPAVVTDNADPEQLGRVKVRFFWQESGDDFPWLRLIHPYGGKMSSSDQHGFYFIPEIGDEVMIGFENDNPDKPFVIGNVYHKNSKPDHWYDADNNKKSIRTRNGNQIIFSDENGNEEIRILNTNDSSPTNEISLSMNNNGKISIKSKGELEISAESIKISARNDITVDSGQNTKFTANDYQLDANNGIQMTGQKIDFEGTNTSMKGTADLKMEGANTSMKGTTELKMEGAQTKIEATVLKMEGRAQSELKGAIVKVSGTAITEVKGGLVKIN